MSNAFPKNYRLPAEFEKQEAIWLSWPTNKESCPKTYNRLQDKFGEIVAYISRYQRVRINAPFLAHMGIRLSIADNEGDLSQVDIYENPTNDVWCRDHGPVLLNKNRNPKMSKADVEKELKGMLGVDTICWLKEGIEGDDTDGHVDDVVRFIREDALICMVEPKDTDPNHRVLKDIRERLDDLRAPDGSKMEIIEIEMPQAVEVKDWRLSRLPASYANFLIVNNAVLMPIFGQKKKDAMAEDKMSECFPGREVISVTAKDLVMEGGALHCIAMQEPKAGL